ncbi:MAG: hypothetical protein ACUVRH_01085 [Candidatus Bipolaricaulia bacterium]
MGERLKLRQRRALILAGAAILLLTGALTFLAGEFIRAQLIRPLLFLLQMVGLYLRAIPQFGLWAVLLLLFVLFGLYSIHGLRLTGVKARQRQRMSPMPPASAGPLTELAERIALANRGEYFKWRLRRELRDLLVALLAWRRGLPQEEALRLLRAGEDWPAEVEPRLREFFQSPEPERRYPFFLRPRRRGNRFEEELAGAIRCLEGLAGRPWPKPPTEEEGDGA